MYHTSNERNDPKVVRKSQICPSAASTAKKRFDELTWEEKCARNPFLTRNRHRKAAMSTGGMAHRKTLLPPKKEELNAKIYTGESSSSKSEDDVDKQPAVSNPIEERKNPSILNNDNNVHISNAIVSDGVASHGNEQIENSSFNAYCNVLRRKSLTLKNRVEGWLADNVGIEEIVAETSNTIGLDANKDNFVTANSVEKTETRNTAANMSDKKTSDKKTARMSTGGTAARKSSPPKTYAKTKAGRKEERKDKEEKKKNASKK